MARDESRDDRTERRSTRSTRLDVPRDTRRSMRAAAVVRRRGVRSALGADRALPRHRDLHHLDDGRHHRLGASGTSSDPTTCRWDDYPFIFLTLMLSLQASYAAPLILLATNRQESRDRVNLEQDRETNARAPRRHGVPGPRGRLAAAGRRRGRDPRLRPLRAALAAQRARRAGPGRVRPRSDASHDDDRPPSTP